MFTPASAAVPFTLAGVPNSAAASPFGGAAGGMGSPLHFASTSTPTHINTHSHAASASSASSFGTARMVPLGDAHFGAGMFPGAHASRVVGHFPTAASSLAEAGLSRSAQLLLEMSLTFYSPGLAAVAAGTLPPGQAYKPQAGEVNIMPPPAALALFGQCCSLQGEHRRAVQYLKTALAEQAKLRRQSPSVASSLGCLASPEYEWTLQLIDVHAELRDEAQAQKLLEQLYNATQKHAAAGSAAPGVAAPVLPAKYLLMLARLYSAPATPVSERVPQSTTVSNPAAAVTIHTQILMRHPLAVESALELIRLNVDPRPIVSKAWGAAGGGAAIATLMHQCTLLHLFLTAHWNAHMHRYTAALSGGFNLLVSLAPRSTYLQEQKAWAELQCFDGDPSMRTLAHVHSIDPYALGGMGLLAWLYHRRKGTHRELNVLLAHIMRVDDEASETWQCAALQAHAIGGHLAKEKSERYLEKAMMLAQRAPCNFTRPCPSVAALAFPLFIKGALLYAHENDAFESATEAYNAAINRGENPGSIAATPALDESIKTLRKALSLAPDLLVLQYTYAQTLVLHAHMALHQATVASGQSASLGATRSYRLAVGVVRELAANPLHKGNARVHANHGLVLSVSPEERQGAARALQQAHTLDAEFADVSLALADMYCASKQFPDALSMLKTYVERAAHIPAAPPTAGATLGTLMTQRDTFLARMGIIHLQMGAQEADARAQHRQQQAAMALFKQALTLNPQCAEAVEAMEEMEREARGDSDDS